ncbi:hypothetical protein [Mesorhizobium sp. M0220]|uniref:hypothetical protein n=1 Tax=Mesorhizobium sp. M0220 TaxID=2956920 RepID=UPI003336620A
MTGQVNVINGGRTKTLQPAKCRRLSGCQINFLDQSRVDAINTDCNDGEARPVAAAIEVMKRDKVPADWQPLTDV